jgi:hypothetical protein
MRICAGLFDRDEALGIREAAACHSGACCFDFGNFMMYAAATGSY